MTVPRQTTQRSHLLPSFESTRVADVMRAGIVSCEPDLPAVAVTRMMATHRIHAVVVEGCKRDAVHGWTLVWGVVSDLDLARAAHAGAGRLTAADLAATEPVTIESSAHLTDAARIMDEHATAHLIVVDDDRPVGVISTLDVAGALGCGCG